MRKRNLFIVWIMALLVSLVPTWVASPADAATSSEEEAPTLLGFATGRDWREDLSEFEAEAGKYPAFHEVFRTLDKDWSANHLPAFFQDAHDLGMVSWMITYVDDISAFADGAYDDDLNSMVSFFSSWMEDDDTKRLVIAPFPEANLASHAWSGDPESFRKAFKRIRSAFRESGLGPDQVRFAFVMNGISSEGFSYDQFYPGDQYVDILSFNKHNRNIELSSDDPWRDYEATFGQHIEEMGREISRTKPIFINQTASVDDELGRRAGWLTDMFAGLKAHDQVIGAVYFNRLKEESSGNVSDFRVLVDGELETAFRDGYQTWSDPEAVAWVFDGRMEQWVADREAALDTGFEDVPSNHLFADGIRWMAAEGITKGCNPPDNTLFCPDDSVTRGQMAAFINRFLDPPPASKDHFVDDNGSTFETDINRLAEAGITKGCNPPSNDRFCADDLVSREQMAAFLVRALGLTANTHPGFNDVSSSNTFHDDIARLATAGITKGCNPPSNTNYCPKDFVSRGQMAAFVHRADQHR